MTQGDRVMLVEDFTDEWGRTFAADMLGTVGYDSGGQVIVEFDGFELERAADASAKQRTGECANLVPWLAEVPVRILKSAEPTIELHNEWQPLPNVEPNVDGKIVFVDGSSITQALNEGRPSDK